MTINFNAEPYYDDFDENKKFLKILFRPGYGVQARELNQLQSILQSQISRVGDHLFKEGSVIIPGEIGFDTSLSHVKLTPTVGTSGTDGFLPALVGNILVGQTTGVRAKVLTYTTKTSTDPSMVYVKYINSGTNGTTKVFAASETLVSEETGVTVTVQSSAATGVSSGATIQQGVFYVKKNFVLVEAQTIVIDKYSKTPTAKICLEIVEDTVTPEEDETLLDNAAGSYNYSAPGAHRYTISLNLVKKSYDFTIDEGTNFIEILRVKNGNIEYLVNKTLYNELEHTLARRTYDESGNYIVKNFPINIKEFRNNDRGTYAVNKPYLANDIVAHTTTAGVKSFYRALNTGFSDSNTTPQSTASSTGIVVWQQVSVPPYNNGVYTAPSTYTTTTQHEADEAKLAVGLGAGKGYIFGYEVETKSTFYTPLSKARATSNEQDLLFPTDLGQYIVVQNVNAFPDVSTYPEVLLYEDPTVTLGVSSGVKRGSARIRAIEYESGAIGTSQARYKVFLFNVVMDVVPNTNGRRYSITNRVKQIVIPATTTTATFTADVSLNAVQTSGTVIVNGTSVFGTGTSFTTEYEVGEYVYINGIYARVQTVVSNTAMTLSTNVSGTTSITVDGSNAALFDLTNDIISSTAHGLTTGAEVSYDAGAIVTLSTNSISVDTTTDVITVPSTTGLSAGKVIRFGTNIAGIAASKFYYVKTVPNGTTFTISETSGGATLDLTPEVTKNVTSLVPSTNVITLSDVTSIADTDKIRFSGTTFGGIVAGTDYFVKGAPVGNTIKISTTSGGTEFDITAVTTTATAVEKTTNFVTVSSVAGMAVGNSITLSGTAFGGLAAAQYWIRSIDAAAKKITISTSSTGSVVVFANTVTGSMTVTLDTVATSMTVSEAIVAKTSSLTFDANAIAGLVNGRSYFVFAGTTATPTPNTFVLYDSRTGAETGSTLGRVNITAVGTGTAHKFTRNTTSGVKVEKAFRPLVNAGATSLIFRLPYPFIKNVSDVRYTVSRTYVGTIASGSVAVSCDLPYQFTDPNATGSYQIVSRTTGNYLTYSGATRSNNNTTIVFGGLSSNNGQQVLIQTTLGVSANNLRIKTLKSATHTVTSKTIGESKAIYTGKADGIRVVSVKMDTGSWGQPSGLYTTDITSRFNFVTNQTDSYYGISFIQLKDGQPKPTAPIRIVFEYYEHSGSGDFFSVRSYDGIPYQTIPVYNGLSLADCIDFRPKVTDNFTGAVVFTDDETLMPKFGTDMVLDLEYYLGKKCKVFMDRTGRVTISEGASTLVNQPSAPEISDNILLYNIQLQPYTFGTSSENILIAGVDNKRYTMADIGKLERRINNLEYYTSLSLLESETQNLTIRDADGLEKFKNGFVVDNFTGHAIGDTRNPDYLNSIDFDSRILRPFFVQDQIPFVEVASSNNDRAARNYALTGKYITLPFTETKYVDQLRSSSSEKINPFAFFTFLGSMTITPASDTWFAVERRPDIIVEEKEGNYNTVKNLAEKAGVLGTIWGAWSINWAGRTENVLSSKTYAARTVGGGNFAGGWGINGNSFTVSTVQVSTPKSRKGTETYVKSIYEERVLEDKILSTTILPYMRSRRLAVQTKSLKGGTVFYPFFDGRNIQQYCTPAEKIIFNARTGKSTEFDTVSRAGNNYSETARLFAGDSTDLAISVGDVLVEYNSLGTVATGVTAVVVGWEKYEAGPDAGKYAVYVVNRKYPVNAATTGFGVGNVIKGTLSEAEGTIVSATTAKAGGELRTSLQGSLHFIFHVPNTDAVKFNTGSNELALLDVETYDKKSSTSSATKAFTASGVYQERQNQIQRIRNGELATKQVDDFGNDLSDPETRFSNSPGWYDPLAQTFLVQETNGVFVTSVDLYFYKKDVSAPVIVEIREVVNGYPGKNVLTTAKTQIAASQILTSDNASVATNVKFPSPTYLNGNTEYCIVLMSNSDIPEIFVAKQGELSKEDGSQIDKQPYMGVFFKSQNASTWTAEQTIDMKFKLNKAVFLTNTVSNVAFENSNVADSTLDENPLLFTAGSRKVRVSHDNHGMNTDSVVAIKALPPVAIGEIYSATNSAIVSGIGTKFATTNGIVPGAIIYREDGKVIGEVLSVASDTQLTLKANSKSNYGVISNTEPFRFMNPLNGVSPNEIFKVDANGNYLTHNVDSVELDSYVITIGSDNLQSTLNTSSTTVTLSTGDTSNMFAGQPVIKTSGTGVFSTTATVTVASITNSTTFVLSVAPETNGAVVFSVGDIPTVTGKSGGVGVMASRDVPYDMFNPSINIENYTGTNSIITYQGVTGKSMDGAQTPYLTFSNANLPYVNTFSITPGEDNYTPVPMVIASRENSVAKSLNLSTLSSLRNTAVINAELITTNPDLSPIINIENVAITAVSNKTNKPTTSMNIDPIDYIEVVSDDPGIVFNGTGVMVIEDAGLRQAIAGIISGQYIQISGSSVTQNNGTWFVTDVDPEGNTLTVQGTLDAKAASDTITIKALDRYFSERTPVGSSSINKYVTRKLKFANPCTSIKIKFDADVPPAADIGVYYKLNPTGTETDFNFVEYEDARTTVPANLKSKDSAFFEHEIDLDDLPSFDAITVKLVMTSTDSTQIPRISDLRIIALA